MPFENAQASDAGTVLITGAAGFVGGVVALEAAGQGMTVHGCGSRDSSPGGFPGSWHRIPRTQETGPLASVVSEVSPDIVIHAAGSASVTDSLRTPHQDLLASLGSWSVTLEACRLSGQNPVIVFPSSAAVYGNPRSLPIPEETECNPVSPYGWHKVLCENLARSHAAFFGARIVIARLFSVIGIHQRRLLAWELFNQLRQGAGPVRLMGSGEETRDFLGEQDMARALVLLARRESRSPRSAQPLVVNVASGEEVATLRLAGLLVDLCDPGRSIVCLGEVRHGDPLRWRADVSRLKSLLPDLCPLSIEETLRQTVDGWR
jgi:UDP-glucose 4-epimerase